MKRLSYFLFTIIVLLLTQIVVTQTATAQTCYYQVWSDEFNEDGEPSSANWKAQTGATGWGNNELQNYTDRLENAQCSNGTLKITAIKEDFGGAAYTSARLITYDKQSFKYGKIEARMKLPYGKGIWPAFWMLGNNIFTGTNWPACGEIDIMEMVGGVGTGVSDYITYGTPHWANATGEHGMAGGNKKNVAPLSADFHLYSIEWTSTYIRWFFDGVQFHEFNTTLADRTEFNNDYFILLNLAVGGNWPGNPDATTVFPQVLEVDYVRVYSTDVQPVAIQGDVIASAGKTVSFNIDKPLDGITYTWKVPADATIVAGQGSSKVDVAWGATSGKVECAGVGKCALPAITSFNVEALVSPSGTSYVFPLASGGVSLWTKNNSTVGLFDVTANANSNIELAFDYTGGKIESYISYSLPTLIDFSQFNQCDIAIKPLSGNVPRNVRVDLLDINGSVNRSDLFVISSFNPKHNFYTYSHVFDASSTTTLLGAIKSARVYVNSGVTNLVTKGSFEVGSIKMSKVGALGIVTIPSDTAYVLPMQDSANLLWSGVATGGNSVVAALSGTSVEVSYNIVDVSSEVKLVYTLPNLLDMGFYNQFEMKMLKDIGSDLPSNISVAIIDSNGVSNTNDSWLLSNYLITNASGYLYHAFGNSSNGGEWLSCRTRKIELTINKDIASAASGKFLITSQRIVKEPVNTSWTIIGNQLNELHVYPNPITDFVNVDLISYTGSATVTISDLSGRMVIQSVVNAGSVVPVSTAILIKGIYMLNVVVNSTSQSILLSKE